MKKIFLGLGLFVPCASFSSFPRHPEGARCLGSASQGLLFKDVFCTANNAALISNLQGKSIALASCNQYLTPVRCNSLLFVVPLQQLSFGAHFKQTGISGYSENLLQLSLSRKISSSASLGISLHNCLQLSKDYPAQFLMIPEIAGYLVLNPGLELGAVFYNPAQQRIRNSPDDRVNSFAKAEIAYNADRKLDLFTAISVDMENGAAASIGLEYAPADSCHLRLGYRTAVNTIHAGVGYKLRHFSFDLGFSVHPYLGLSSALNIIYSL